MKLPSRDSLLDVEWLISAAEREGLRELVTDAAGVYGGAVTGVAEAVRDLSWLARGLRSVDLRHGLAHALTTGSWSMAPSGGRKVFFFLAGGLAGVPGGGPRFL